MNQKLNFLHFSDISSNKTYLHPLFPSFLSSKSLKNTVFISLQRTALFSTMNAQYLSQNHMTNPSNKFNTQLGHSIAGYCERSY